MIRVFHDLESLSRAAARWFAEQAVRDVAERGVFFVALSGGTTPRRTYEILASEPLRGEVPWEGVHVFWGDERCVPPDHPESNAHMARQALLDLVPVPAGNVHPVRGDLPPEEAARDYEAELHGSFSGASPRFDLILLGMGSDGHTASLFPGAPVLRERKRWTAVADGPADGPSRVTLTLPVLNAARVACFLVAGTDKAKTLSRVIQGSERARQLPAARVRPENGALLWFVDHEAAGKMEDALRAGQADDGEQGKESAP